MWVVCSGRIVYIYLAKTLEDEFWEKHGPMVEVMDTFITPVGGIYSCEEGSDIEDSSSNSELARPLSDR